MLLSTRCLHHILLICTALLSQTFASPTLLGWKNVSKTLQPANRGFANNLWLRIMPLGASITYGYTSSDGNGYREYLRDMIVDYGNNVNMVGSRRNGTMDDNDVEGWPGFIIEQVHKKAKTALPKYKPNVVLINVGTNDCSGNIDIPKAGERLTSLLDDVYKGSPHATVILSTLLVRSDPKIQKCVLNVNEQIRSVANTEREKGYRLVLADMQPPSGPTTSELVDGTHPTDAGYAKMATIWFNGISEADEAGFLLPKESIPGNPYGNPDRGVYDS
ncbi:carbohydrate esterase family 3 protein [Xylaria sp. CBS 124048]|nr:carbohydrate esterase family 3 protein [Xylaria sp. CBS 124048]